MDTSARGHRWYPELAATNRSVDAENSYIKLPRSASFCCIEGPVVDLPNSCATLLTELIGNNATDSLYRPASEDGDGAASSGIGRVAVVQWPGMIRS